MANDLKINFDQSICLDCKNELKPGQAIRGHNQYTLYNGRIGQKLGVVA